MQSRDRILAKVDELQGYLRELRQIRVNTYQEYATSIEKRRSTERLLQISIESVIDICSLIASGLKLGLPGSEEDLLERVGSTAIFQPTTMAKIRGMRSFRNILVEKYGRIDDQLVYSSLNDELVDFDTIIEETLQLLRRGER